VTKRRSNIFVHLLLAVGSIAMFFPLLWLILLSVSDNPSSGSTLVELITKPFTFINYSDILTSDNYFLYFFNTFVMSFGVAAGSCLFCTYIAYAFARMEFRYKNILFGSVLVVMMVPVYVVMIPLYREIVVFGWINSYAALILPFMVSPLAVFLLKQYIEELPKELEEAAIIDGSSLGGIFRRIIFPLCKPMLIVLFLYQFLNTWNTFLFPFLFTNTDSMRVLPVALTFYQGKQSVDIGHLMAGAGLSAIPVLVLFAIFQKRIITGLTAGAVKG
jgi:multiple sugar transport system permease protein